MGRSSSARHDENVAARHEPSDSAEVRYRIASASEVRIIGEQDARVAIQS